MRHWLSLLVATACAASPPPKDPPQSAPSLHVIALSHPVGWLAQALIGPDGQVTVMVPQGQDPPHWRPTSDQIANLAHADLLVAQGAGYEPWVDTANLPRDRAVFTTKGLDLIARDGKTHRHGDAGEHHHGAVDPHTWLDPLLYLGQAQALHRHLVRRYPDHRQAWDDRLGDLRAEILATHADLQAALGSVGEVPMRSNHPTWAYLARRYDLTIPSVDIPPRGPVTDKETTRLKRWMDQADVQAASHAPTLLWEAEPSQELRRALPDGLRHRVVDPVEQPVDGRYDWPARLRATASAMQGLLSTP